MAVSCDPSDLSAAAAAFRGLSEEEHLAVQTYLLAVIAGGSLDPNTLEAAASAFRGAGHKSLEQIQSYLLCQIVNL